MCGNPRGSSSLPQGIRLRGGISERTVANPSVLLGNPLVLIGKSDMNSRYWLAPLLVGAALVACDRTSVDYAAKSGGDPKVNGAPAYTTSANVSVTGGDTFVKAAFPSDTKGPDGAALYMKTCMACHQMTGQGIPGAFPPLANSPYVTGDNVDRLAAIMLYGLMGPIKVNGVQYNSVMAPWAQLKDEELAAIATYVRSSWGNSASAVTADVFAAARTKHGTRAAFSITELGEEG